MTDENKPPFRDGPKGRKACKEYIAQVLAQPMHKCEFCGGPTRSGDWFDYIDGYKGPLFDWVCETCYRRMNIRR